MLEVLDSISKKLVFSEKRDYTFNILVEEHLSTVNPLLFVTIAIKRSAKVELKQEIYLHHSGFRSLPNK